MKHYPGSTHQQGDKWIDGAHQFAHSSLPLQGNPTVAKMSTMEATQAKCVTDDGLHKSNKESLLRPNETQRGKESSQ